MNAIRYIAVIISLLIFQSNWAQSGAKLFVSDEVEGYEGACIKWVTPELYSNSGYHLYRSTNSGAWEKVNEVPITLNQSIDTNLFTVKADRGLYRAITSMDYNKFQENKLLKVFVVLQGIHSNQFASAIGMMTNDPGATAGQSVQYKLMEGEVEVAVSTVYKMGSFSGVNPPDSIVLQRDKKGVHVIWKPEELRYSGVWINRSTDMEFSRINEVPARPRKLKNGKWGATFFSDFEVEKELSYEYQFIARDYFGRESEPTKSFAAPALKQTDSPGAIITNVTTKASEMKVVLDWECEKGDDLKGFKVYTVQDTDTIEKTNTLLSPETNTFEFATTSIGWQECMVEAVFTNVSKKSNTARIFLGDVIPPSAPNGLQVKADTGKFIFSWNASDAADLDGYKIYRSLVGTSNTERVWTPITGKVFDSTQFVYELADNVTSQFAFYVAAIDTNYNTSKEKIEVIAALPDVYAPQKPLIKAIDIIKKDSSELLQISWIPNTDADLKEYNLYKRAKGDTGSFKKVNFSALPIASMRYTDRLAKPGIRYEYRLQATDTNGLKSEMSAPFYGGLPVTSKNLKPTGIKVSTNHKKKQINLSWNEVAPKNLEGFTIYSGKSQEIMRPATGLSKKNTQSFNVPEPGIYFVQVRAISTKGKVEKSEIIQVTINQKK